MKKRLEPFAIGSSLLSFSSIIFRFVPSSWQSDWQR
jgi:hypothetical protein